ncbi:MAG: DUF1302 domain-containing protein [Thioalkalivibrio sp.]|nr:MAG: DUF1302 domain-containing protein [Thioalkalivibrio sp.]
MSRKKHGSGARLGRAGTLAAGVAIALGAGAPVHGFEISSDDGEVWGSFDTTVSLGARWRMQKPDDALIGIANGGTARSVNEDNGNLNWDRGDVVSLAAQVTHDLDLNYRNYGAFVRATYFYDDAVMSKDELGSEARDQAGRDFEILDAYVRGDFDVGDRWLGVRLGRQVVNWGESTFIQNGINVLNPIDVSRLRIPGSELREGLMPLNMLWAAHDLTDRLSVEGVLMLEWEETRIDPEGTFFSSNDFLSPGGENVFAGFGRRNDLRSPPAEFFLDPEAQLWAPRAADREASDSGQYGIALRYFAEQLNFTEFGVYFARYHSRTPFASGTEGDPTAFLGGEPTVLGEQAAEYFAEYPEGIRLWGLSFNTPGPWGIALQGEYSYRPNQPVQIAAPELLLAALGQRNQIPQENIGADGEIQGYQRVTAQQVQLSATKAFGPTLGAQQFVAVGEVGYTHLDLPRDVPFNAPGVFLPAPGSDDTTSFGSVQEKGYASRDSWGYRIVGRMDYPNAIGAATLSPRAVFSHDVSGRSPTFNEGARSLTLGLGINYLQNLDIDLSYTSFFGGEKIKGTDPNAAFDPTFPPNQSASYSSHTNPLKDRDFLAVSVSYSF